MNNYKIVQKQNIFRIGKVRNLAVGVVTAGAMMVGGTSSAMALDDVFEEKLRILNCAVLLFTDPELHPAECGVGDTSGSESLAPLIFVIPPPPPPPSSKPPECDHNYEWHNHECQSLYQ